MRTALDTNILSALFSSEPGSQALAQHINSALHAGTVVICPAVYVEILAHPTVSISQIDHFLTSTGIIIDYVNDPDLWLLAGTAFRQYAQRRRAARGGQPRGLLADFIIGAHASLHADRLFTLDRTRYSRDFPKLRLN